MKRSPCWRSATNYFHADGLGSVTSLSNAAGALVQSYTYDSFGKQTASSGSLTNSFQYTARESDTETGLYYYRARYYDPTTGRFLSEDPLEFGGGDVDFYAYTFNDPTNFVDPFGLSGTGTLAPPAPPTTGTLPGTGTTGTGTIPGTGAKPVLPAGDGFPWGGFVRGALIELGRELLFPTPTSSNDQPHPGLYNPKCDTGKSHPCYIQYKADERWCREKYINNEALYDYCMLIADENLARCLDGLPRAPRDPNDPRYIRKRRK